MAPAEGLGAGRQRRALGVGWTLEVVRVRSEGGGARRGCRAARLGPDRAQKSRDGDRRYVLTGDSWRYLTGWAP